MATAEAFETVFDYIPAARHGRILCLAGQIPKTGPQAILHTGRVGEAVDLEQARQSATVAAEQALAWLGREAGGLSRVERILRVTVYVAVADDFEAISQVADAASGTFSRALGEEGRHPRSVIGVARLPRNAPVLLEVTAVLTGD